MVHLAHHPHESISKLVPWAGLILSVILCIIFLVKSYLFEGFLMKRCYGKAYLSLSETNRRGFVNHHCQATIRILLLLLGGYPFLAVAFGRSYLSTSYLGTKDTTLGDMLLICSQLLVSMYVLELLYRTKVSPVACLHHLGTILVAQAAVSLSIDGHKDSVYEFVLCCVWGAFDVIAEFLPNIAIILYRTRPDDHIFLRKFFYITAATTFAGTVSETIVAMWLFGALWDKWDLSFKVATPLLHLAFSAAQFHGSRIFYGMAKREGQRIREIDGLKIMERGESPSSSMSEGLNSSGLGSSGSSKKSVTRP